MLPVQSAKTWYKYVGSEPLRPTMEPHHMSRVICNDDAFSATKQRKSAASYFAVSNL